MPMFRVTWEIDVDADTHEEAAVWADDVMRDPESLPFEFKVRQHHVEGEHVIDLDPQRAAEHSAMREKLAERNI